MQITAYTSAAAFLGRAQGFLERHEALNNLMLGLSLRSASAQTLPRRPLRFASVENGDALVLAAMITPPHDLVLAGDQADLTGAIDLLVEHLRADAWPVPGMIAAPPLAEAFARAWRAATGQPYHVSMNQRIYRLAQVRHPDYPPGKLAAATERQIELIAEWMMAFAAEALTAGAWEDLLLAAQRRVRAGEIYLWLVGGEPVAMAGSTRPTRRGICINAVYTPPAQRRNGYASACVAALSQHLLDSGWSFCMLYTDLSNPTSNAIYQQIGYQAAGESILYRFGR